MGGCVSKHGSTGSVDTDRNEIREPHRQGTVATPGLTKAGKIPITVSIVGDGRSGKTSLLQRLVHDEYHSQPKAGCGRDLGRRTLKVNDSQILVFVWDVDCSFTEEYRTNYYRHSQGIILVFDATNKKSFENLRGWIDEIRRHYNQQCPVLLVATKCDLTEGRVVNYMAAKDFANEIGILFFEVSAQDGTNVELAFVAFLEEISQMREC